MKLRHGIYRNLFPHTFRLVLSALLPSADLPSLDSARTQTKSTQAQGHCAALRPPSGTGCQARSKRQKTWRLFDGTEIIFVFNSLVTHRPPPLQSLTGSLFPLFLPRPFFLSHCSLPSFSALSHNSFPSFSPLSHNFFPSIPPPPPPPFTPLSHNSFPSFSPFSHSSLSSFPPLILSPSVTVPSPHSLFSVTVPSPHSLPSVTVPSPHSLPSFSPLSHSSLPSFPPLILSPQSQFPPLIPSPSLSSSSSPRTTSMWLSTWSETALYKRTFTVTATQMVTSNQFKVALCKCTFVVVVF